MARLAFNTTFRDGSGPGGKRPLIVVIWVSEEDQREEAEQTPAAFTIHINDAAALRYISEHPPDAPYKQSENEGVSSSRILQVERVSTGRRGAKEAETVLAIRDFWGQAETAVPTELKGFAIIDLAENHNAFFLLEMGRVDGLLLEGKGSGAHYQLFRELSRILYPSEDGGLGTRVVPLRPRLGS